MIYKFKSKATGDLILLGPSGDQLLRIVGREPARQGIFEPPQMAACIQALSAAIEADDARRAASRTASDRGAEPVDRAVDDSAADDAPGRRGVTLRQRAWPMIEMMRRAQAEDEPIVWGV